MNDSGGTASHGYGASLPHISQHLLPSSRVQNGQVTFNNHGWAYSAEVVSDAATGGDTPFGHAPIGPPRPNHRKATIYTKNIRISAGASHTNSLISKTIGHELGHLAHLDHCPKSDEPDANGNSWKTRCLMWGTISVRDQSSVASHHDADYALADPGQDPQEPYDAPPPNVNPGQKKAKLVPANSSYSAEAGDSHTVNFSTSSPYSSVYWYVKTPSDISSLGTTQEIDQGDGSLTTADFTYTFPSGTSGDYTVTAYVYDWSNSVYEVSYTVSVSLPSSSTTTTSSSSSSNSLVSSDGVYTATAGDSHTANLSVPSGWTSIYWYLKSPSESGVGTSQSSVSDSTGNSTTASYTYSFPSGVSGDYVLTAYTTLSDYTIVQPSYTVSVSLPSSSNAPASAPSAPASTASGTLKAASGYSLTITQYDAVYLKLTTTVPFSAIKWYLVPSWSSIESYKGTQNFSPAVSETSYSTIVDTVFGEYTLRADITPTTGNTFSVSCTVTVADE